MHMLDYFQKVYWVHPHEPYSLFTGVESHRVTQFGSWLPSKDCYG